MVSGSLNTKAKEPWIQEQCDEFETCKTSESVPSILQNCVWRLTFHHCMLAVTAELGPGVWECVWENDTICLSDYFH